MDRCTIGVQFPPEPVIFATLVKFVTSGKATPTNPGFRTKSIISQLYMEQMEQNVCFSPIGLHIRAASCPI